jgi:hypothetical protein
MSVTLAVALLALLVALFSLVALVAVYARVRALEAGRALLLGNGALSGYAALVGRRAPAAVRPRPGERVAVVAVLDADCGLCHDVWDAMGAAAGRATAPARFVGLAPAGTDLPEGGPVELLADPAARADLYEGYSPTLLAVDADGTVVHRTFVYPDTELAALLHDLSEGREVSRS